MSPYFTPCPSSHVTYTAFEQYKKRNPGWTNYDHHACAQCKARVSAEDERRQREEAERKEREEDERSQREEAERKEREEAERRQREECISLPSPEGQKVQVHWREVEPIASGEGRDAAVSFASQQQGEAKAEVLDTRKRQAARLENARRAIAELPSAASADLQAASRALVTGCIVDTEGWLALNLLSLSSEEGGLAEALAEHLPLLAARCLASQLGEAVPQALGRLQESADAASEKADQHLAALTTAEGMQRERQEAMKTDRARAEIASEILDCTEAACSCYANPQTRGGIVRSLQGGQEEARKARDAVAASLAQALIQRRVAEADKAAADQHVRGFNQRLGRVTSELLPLSGDVAQAEGRAAQEALKGLQEAASAAATHLERMQRLVEALEASERACSEVLRGEEQAAQAAAASAARATKLHATRRAERDAAQLVLDQQRPAEDRFAAILNQAQINLSEAKDRQAFAQESLKCAQKGWLVLQTVVDGRLREREAEHASRLRARDLAGLEEDDLRTLLAGRGLGAVFDQIKASEALAPRPCDGASLADVMRRRKPFAEKLDEVLEATMGVKDVCARKRAVHVIELAALGMDIDRYSEGGAEGTCCCWSEEQVRRELRGRGVNLSDAQLRGVNGEVLLLLRDMNLEQLQVGAGLKLDLMDAVLDCCSKDRVGRIRAGLEEPPAPGVGAVDAREAQRVCDALDKAAREDGEPCVIPAGLVSMWTDDFAESRLVGTGAFGAVYEGISSSAGGAKGRVVAVKRLSADTMLKGGEKHMKREINVMHRFKHPNIIRLLGYTAASEGGCIVYEMGSRGSLAHNLLDQALAEALTWKHRVRVAHGLSRALNYLHCNDPSAPALHRDVKSANVVLCADFTPKLIDCGLARYSGAGQRPAGTVAATTGGAAVGTPGYMCPRYSRGGVDFDAKCEVFSVGVVLLELITGKVQGAGPDSDLYFQYVEEEEEVVPDPRAGAWLDVCFNELKGLAFECVEKYGKRIPAVMTVLRRLRELEDAHCRQTEEEARQARELVLLQGEKDAGRADGVFAEKLRRQVRAQEEELARLRDKELRLAEARAEEARRAEEEMRECCVCFDRLRGTAGISCEAGLHFHCDGCFSAEVKEQCALENFAAFKHAEMGLRCRACLPKKSFFDKASVPAHLDGESFTAYLRARERVEVGKAVQEQDLCHEKQVQELRAQLAAAQQQASSNRQAAVLRHRMHIVENILTLKCPRATCKTAFIDFDGCFALTCSRCGGGFCAYCLEDCGRDAHAHVAGCRHNTAGGSVHAPIDAFHRAQKARVTRLLREYIAGQVEEDARRDLVGSMGRDLADLGISGQAVLQ